MKKTMIAMAMAVSALSLSTSASMMLTLTGKVYSLTTDSLVLQVQNQLITIKRSELDEEELKQTERSGMEVTFQVPSDAITSMKKVAKK